MNNFNDIKKIFPVFDNNPGITYFDSAATSLKPWMVIDKINQYYQYYSVSADRSEYKMTIECKKIIDYGYTLTKQFINSESESEINFTANATDSLNIIARCLALNIKKGDDIVVSDIEHSSNMIPWIIVARKKKANIIWLKTNNNQIITLENLKKVITKKTRIVAINTISNVIGKINEYIAIGKYLEKKSNCFYVLDATQSIAHIRFDVKNAKIDFAAFSFHKMFGPTGIGCMYVNSKNLDLISSNNLGGGIIENIFPDENDFTLKDAARKFVAGTPNYAGIFGAIASIEFIQKLTLKAIHEHEKTLINHFAKKIKEYPQIKWYNPNPDIAIFCFNVDNYFCQDVAQELNRNAIYLRVGDNCAKLLNIFNKENRYLRASLSIYNSCAEIDKLFSVIDKGGDFLGEFF